MDQEKVFCPYFERLGVCLEPQACFLYHTKAYPVFEESKNVSNNLQYNES